MRWIIVSMLVHALVLAWLARGASEQTTEWHVPVLPAYAHIETETFVELVEDPVVKREEGGGVGSPLAHARAPHGASRTTDAWEQISIRTETGAGAGAGDGNGIGDGRGNGIGFGHGGGIRVARDVPAPPAPPAISKARPAKLVWPTRDEQVDDEASLFLAKVTVDESGDVAGARMMTLRLGAKADRAANAIWTFRYSPALDDDGKPIRSTFEQSFQLR